jgi:2-methylcitrate dehydratase PrpD
VTQAVSGTARLGDFTIGAAIPAEARTRAARAVLDTVGVTLAGISEPASRIVRDTIAVDGGDACAVLGTAVRSSAVNAALANGTAAHALDFDDMCFVSLAHPSAPLVAAAIAAAEAAGASGRALLDAYVAGFEIEARLGRLMNPRHYERGWHCTSTLGTIGAAAAASRLLGLDRAAAGHALAIAASEASGVKENFGTMVKPLHAGLAARNGVLAALFAGGGMTASGQALDGPQGFLRALDSEREGLGDALADLGSRWEIVDTGITVKLYPSCAGTHPTLDAILDLRRRDRFEAGDVDRIEIGVDSITPTVLIYPRPATGLEAKFSMPFCAAAAVVFGAVGVETFDTAAIANPAVRALMPRIVMRVDPTLDGVGPPLTEARVAVTLRDGRVLRDEAHGARGYPERPASSDELTAKFLSCATRALPEADAHRALELLRAVERLDDVRTLTAACTPDHRRRGPGGLP